MLTERAVWMICLIAAGLVLAVAAALRLLVLEGAACACGYPLFDLPVYIGQCPECGRERNLFGRAVRVRWLLLIAALLVAAAVATNPSVKLHAQRTWISVLVRRADPKTETHWLTLAQIDWSDLSPSDRRTLIVKSVEYLTLTAGPLREQTGGLLRQLQRVSSSDIPVESVRLLAQRAPSSLFLSLLDAHQSAWTETPIANTILEDLVHRTQTSYMSPFDFFLTAEFEHSSHPPPDWTPASISLLVGMILRAGGDMDCRMFDVLFTVARDRAAVIQALCEQILTATPQFRGGCLMRILRNRDIDEPDRRLLEGCLGISAGESNSNQ